MSEDPPVPRPPIGPYRGIPASVEPWDPRTVEVAARVSALVRARRPGTIVEHIGSSAVPGLPGKNVVDLAFDVAAGDVGEVAALLLDLGFRRQAGPRAFPPTRPLLLGSLEHEGATLRIHAHVMPRGHRLWGRDFDHHVGFRDALRADRELREEYAALKADIVGGGTTSSLRYSLAKTEWIRTQLRRLGLLDPPIGPPATIGVLGGGQLGRMLGYAARALGYGLVVLDPDPACPASGVADEVVVGGYDDTGAALAMAESADVVTYELEHISFDLVARLDWDWAVRPGLVALAATQDRLAERLAIETEGIAVAPWREVRTDEDLRVAARALGLPLRLKVATGGYDGRGQLRLVEPADLEGAIVRLGRPPGDALLAERELDFAMELSVIAARDEAGRTVTFPVARNRHDDGILVESVAPAPVPAEVAAAAQSIGRRLAEGLDVVGTLAVELFLLADGSLVVNELAPRVHNTGHWTIEACATSQFEQHIRAICGLPLGSTDLHTPVAMVNLLGTGPRRRACVGGVDEALDVPGVHVHLYGKREVFERRKMGHVVATGSSVEGALERARMAAAAVRWEDEG
jgi:5-(carboxyamino)imidazole ribonucleotide synthase